MKKHKSLLIVGLPRSGSTAFESVCLQILKTLGFKRGGEFLNRGFKKNRIKFRHNTRDKKHFENMKKRCKARAYNVVLRDVVQTRFITENIKWLSERFNIIYLVRPEKEIVLCCRLIGWRHPVRKLFRVLDVLTMNSRIKRFDYYDFVFGPTEKLHKLLKQWYPKCRKANYLVTAFVQKRNKTIHKIKRYGIKPKRV